MLVFSLSPKSNFFEKFFQEHYQSVKQFGSDCADVQADLNFRCMHMLTCTLYWVPAPIECCIFSRLSRGSDFRMDGLKLQLISTVVFVFF